MSKKICYVTTIAPTLQTFVLPTAEYLHKNGDYDITLICDHNENFKNMIPDYMKYRPVNMERGIDLTFIRIIYHLYKIFKEEQFDIVQYSTPNASLYTAIAAFLARINVRLYAQWGIYYVGSSGLKRKIFKVIEKIVCSLSTAIQPDSYGNLEFSLSEGLYPQSKGSVIWNGSACGIDLERFDIQNKAQWRQEVFNELDLPTDSIIVGFVGRINRDKGIYELLQAMQQVISNNQKVVLLLIGDFEEKALEGTELYQWSVDCTNVFYCGRKMDIEKYYASMDIFVLPSYREGFGMVVIEAQALGVPTIVTNIPGPTDAMVESKTGLTIPVKNTEKLIEAVKRLIEDKEFRDYLSNNSIDFVKEKFEANEFRRQVLNNRNKLIQKSK